jgi:hypothetical protein
MRFLMDLDKNTEMMMMMTSLLSGDSATEQSYPTPPFHMLCSLE